jgi:hypothetical protein
MCESTQTFLKPFDFINVLRSCRVQTAWPGWAQPCWQETERFPILAAHRTKPKRDWFAGALATQGGAQVKVYAASVSTFTKACASASVSSLSSLPSALPQP